MIPELGNFALILSALAYFIPAVSGGLPVVYAAQYQAAVEGAGYTAGVLAEQGVWIAPEVWVSPASLVDIAPDGQASAQSPQPMHLETSMMLFSVSVAPVGHT